MGYSTTAYLAYGVVIPKLREPEHEELRDGILEKVNSRKQIDEWEPYKWDDYDNICWSDVAEHWCRSRVDYATLIKDERVLYPDEPNYLLECSLANKGLLIQVENAGNCHWDNESNDSIVCTIVFEAYEDIQVISPCMLDVHNRHASMIKEFFYHYNIPYPEEGPSFQLFSYYS